MLVPVLVLIVLTPAQTELRPRMEVRTSMALRPGPVGPCKIDISGTVGVGKNGATLKSVVVRDIGARGLRSITGVMRFHTGLGRYVDRPIRYEYVGFTPPIRMSLPAMELEYSIAQPIERVEGIINGAFFADDSVCGENGSVAKSHFEQAHSDAVKDIEEAYELATKLSPAEFEQRLKTDLIKVGPYARSTTANFNRSIAGQLLRADGKLTTGYKVIIAKMRSMLTPAKQSRPTQSSQPLGQGIRSRGKASS